MIKLARERCCYPTCGEWANHQHHVTYTPEVIKPLCRTHHEDITIINGQQARKYRRGLSNQHRWWIWFQWLEGKLRPRRTRKALDYIGEWNKRPLFNERFLISDEVVIRTSDTKSTNESKPRRKKKKTMGKKAVRSKHHRKYKKAD